MSCFNMTGKPQTTRHAANGKRLATAVAKERAKRIAAEERSTKIDKP